MNANYDISKADNSTDNSADNSTSDKNERVIWEFTIGIPIDPLCEYESDTQIHTQTQNFENAVCEMTMEITKITDGLTYEYCYGMWLRRNQGTLGSQILSNENNIEHNLSVQISIIVLPEIENEIYNFVKNIILKINKKYDLGIMHIQAMKTIGTAHHFLVT